MSQLPPLPHSVLSCKSLQRVSVGQQSASGTLLSYHPHPAILHNQPSHHYTPPHHCCGPQSLQCLEPTDQSLAAAPAGLELSGDTMSTGLTMLLCCWCQSEMPSLFTVFISGIVTALVSIWTWSIEMLIIIITSCEIQCMKEGLLVYGSQWCLDVCLESSRFTNKLPLSMLVFNFRLWTLLPSSPVT